MHDVNVKVTPYHQMELVTSDDMNNAIVLQNRLQTEASNLSASDRSCSSVSWFMYSSWLLSRDSVIRLLFSKSSSLSSAFRSCLKGGLQLLWRDESPGLANMKFELFIVDPP